MQICLPNSAGTTSPIAPASVPLSNVLVFSVELMLQGLGEVTVKFEVPRNAF